MNIMCVELTKPISEPPSVQSQKKKCEYFVNWRFTNTEDCILFHQLDQPLFYTLLYYICQIFWTFS